MKPRLLAHVPEKWQPVPDKWQPASEENMRKINENPVSGRLRYTLTRVSEANSPE
jgi:hypothetical protein